MQKQIKWMDWKNTTDIEMHPSTQYYCTYFYSYGALGFQFLPTVFHSQPVLKSLSRNMDCCTNAHSLEMTALYRYTSSVEHCSSIFLWNKYIACKAGPEEDRYEATAMTLRLSVVFSQSR